MLCDQLLKDSCRSSCVVLSSVVPCLVQAFYTLVQTE